MGNLNLLVFFLTFTSRSLAAPAGDDIPFQEVNLEDLFGMMGAASGGDAQAGQANLGDLFGAMGGIMSAVAPEEDAKEIQQQMGQVSQMLGGIGLGAPVGPDSADVALDLNAGAEEPIAAQLQGPYRLEVKDRHSGFPLATEEQVNEHLSTVLEDMNEFCGHWCIARIDGARVHGFGHGAKISPIDPTHEEEP